MSWRDCIANIRAAADGVLSEEEVEAVLERADRKRRALLRQEGRIVDIEAELAAWGRDEAARQARKARHDKKLAIVQALRRKRLVADIGRLGPKLGHVDAMLAKMHGMNRKAEGVRDSADARIAAYSSRYQGRVMAAVEKRPEVFRLLFARSPLWTRAGWLGKPPPESEAFAERIAREMEERRPDGQPGVTGDEDARWVAELFADALELTRRDLNRLGADIGKLEGYVPHAHDAHRIVGREAEWLAFIKPRLDLEKTFPDLVDDAEIDDALNDIYRSITTGQPREQRPDPERPGRRQPVNLARQLGHERALHFKPGKWSEYAREFGMGNPVYAVFNSLRKSGRIAGLMDSFGPNPEVTIRGVADDLAVELRNRGEITPAIQREIEALKSIDAWPAWRQLSGRADLPGSFRLSRVGGAARVWESLSKLMGATLSATTDIHISASNLRFHGLSLTDSYGGIFREYFRGRGTAETRHIGFLFGEGYQGFIDEMVTPFGDFDAPAGVLSNLLQTGFRISGLAGFTDVGRSANVRMFAADMGSRVDQPFDALPERYRNVLELQGIGPAVWDVLRQGAIRTSDGTAYVTPDGLTRLDDAAFMPLARERLDRLEAGLAERHAQRVQADAREREWMGKRAADLAERMARDQARVDAYVDRIAMRQAGRARALGSRVRRLRTLAELSEAAVHFDRGLDRARARADVRDLFAGLEEGKRGGPGPREQRARAAMEESRAYVHGVALGKRLADVERAIAELERTEGGRIEAELDRLDAAERRMVERLMRRRQQYEQFVERMEQRHSLRQEAAAFDEQRQTVRVERVLEEVRVETEINLRRFFADETGFGVLVPDSRSRKWVTGGLQSGTWWGEASRAFFQFKSFPIGFTQRVLGRGLYSQPGSGATRLMNTSLHMGELLATLWVAGLMAMWAKDIAKGRTPKSLVTEDDGINRATVLAALLQSGGLGIYGDFLFGQYNRFGRGLFETIGGPLIGDVSDAVNLLHSAANMEPRASRLLSFATGVTPFINLWYTRAAVDWLFLSSLREAAAPGWMDRQARWLEQQFGQRRLVEPREPLQ